MGTDVPTSCRLTKTLILPLSLRGVTVPPSPVDITAKCIYSPPYVLHLFPSKPITALLGGWPDFADEPGTSTRPGHQRRHRREREEFHFCPLLQIPAVRHPPWLTRGRLLRLVFLHISFESLCENALSRDTVGRGTNSRSFDRHCNISGTTRTIVAIKITVQLHQLSGPSRWAPFPRHVSSCPRF